jgi:hypothetical protein
VTASLLDPWTRPTLTVREAAGQIGVSERAMYDALAPGGDLEHLAVRVGRRVVVKTAGLRLLLGLAEEPE